MKKASKVILILVAVLLTLTAKFYPRWVQNTNNAPKGVQTNVTTGELVNPVLWDAYQQKIAKRQILGKGTIVKLLKDDTQGSKHQRFIVRVNPQQTVLVTHNIDLAPAVTNPKVGESLVFYGEYVWNKQGGVIHWTHHDPQKKHRDGWLDYKGQKYQ